MRPDYLKIYKSAVGNVRKSLERSVNVDSLLGEIKGEASLQEAQKLAKHTALYFWDLGKRATEHIAVGDNILIATDKRLYRGRIVELLNDPEGGIGDAIGWARQFKKPWDNPIAFEKIEVLDLDRKLREWLEDVIVRGCKITRSFYQIDGLEKSKREEQQPRPPSYRIQEVVSRVAEPDPPTTFGKSEESTQRGVAATFGDVVNRVRILKDSPHHSERDHESIVEQFFSCLGYSRSTDIWFRVGHVDILINPNSNDGFVVEVKRTWGLSRESTDVIDQAYRYAHNQGKRFVVITNGDYFGFFDRLKGLSVADNFVTEFFLSNMSDEDFESVVQFEKTRLEGG